MDSGFNMNDTLNRVLSLISSSKVKKKDFLAAIGLSRSALSGWTSGNNDSYLKYLPQIAAYFNVSLDWLAGNEQKNKPSTQESLTDIDVEFLNKIKVLSPENRAQAEKMIDFLLAGQDKKE